MLQLVYHPDERLERLTEPVQSITGATVALANEMIDLMHRAQGIGLAGPQVGIMERIFVVHLNNDQPRVFINPEIVARSLDEEPYEEGCLSIPGIYANVRRPIAITVTAVDLAGQEMRVDADGLLARVIQHEYDHLRGVLFLSYLTRRRRERIMLDYEKPE